MAQARAAGEEKKEVNPSEDKSEKSKDESSAKKGSAGVHHGPHLVQDASESESGAKEGEDKAIPEDSWFYLDPSQTPQGPFTWEQMSAWYKAGYLQATLPVMKAGEEDFTPLQEHAAFNSALQTDVPKFEFAELTFAMRFAFLTDPLAAPAAYTAWMASMTQQQQQQFDTLTAQQKMQKYQDYVATANFSLTSGRFQAVGAAAVVAPGGRRVAAADSAGRQLAHYFDIDAWQAQKQREKELGLKPKKVKNWRDLKEARKDRKQRNYVKGLLKD